MTRVRQRSIALSLLALLMASCCLTAMWASMSWQDDLLRVNRNTSYATASGFALTLMHNREEKAKELVTHSQWDRIEQWIAAHEPVDCPPPFPLLPGDVPNFQIRGTEIGDSEAPPDTLRESDITLQVPCPTMISESLYTLTIEATQLRKTNTGWIIEEWGEIHEGRP